MTLSQLTGLCNCRFLSGDPETNISGVCTDSSKVKPGDVFIALRGAHTNANGCVAEAFDRGAAAAGVSDDNLSFPGRTVVFASDTRKALGLICSDFYGKPQHRLVTAAITGTNGKTTTASLLRHILSLSGKRCAMTGTVESVVDGKSLPTEYTTPEPPELFGLMRRAVDSDCTHFVCEASSQALDQQRLYGINFDLGVFTNLSRDHLNYHRSMSEYAAAKLKLFDCSTLHLAGIDCPYSHLFASYPRTMTFSVRTKADFYVENVSVGHDANLFTFIFDGKRYPTRQRLRGEFNVQNSVAAIASAIMLGVDAEEAVRASESFSGVPGRFEFVPTGEDFDIIIDYAHTPEGLSQLLRSVEKIRRPGGKTILVFGCGGDRDKEKRPLMGKVATSLADFTVITSDNPRTEDPNRIIQDIVSGVRKGSTVVVSDRKKAIDYALCAARKNDTVVIAGKGHEVYIDAGSEKLPFDERSVIKEIISLKKRI